MQSRINPISEMPRMQAIGGIFQAVNYIAPTFGARVSVDDAVREECVEIATTEFSHLALTEIIHAYRLWSVRRFEALEMYGGQFNVTQFARVLAGYDQWRAQVKAEIARQKAEADQAEYLAERRRKYLDEHTEKIKAFPKTVKAAIANNKYQRPQDIPEYWYQFAELHEMISLVEGEKLHFAQLAEAQVMAEQRGQLSQARSNQALKTLKSHFENIGPAPVWIRAKQLIVWVKVLGRPV